MDTSFTNSKESLPGARRDERDYAGLTRAEQIRAIELEGYVVVPDVLPPETVEVLRREFWPGCRPAASTTAPTSAAAARCSGRTRPRRSRRSPIRRRWSCCATSSATT